jgi:hypothetical protein
MKEWNDLINNLSKNYSELYHQGITNSALKTLQTLTNRTRNMTNFLRGKVNEQIINQIESFAEYLGWMSQQLPQDANLVSYLYWTLNQLISLLTRVIYTTQFGYRRRDRSHFPFIFIFWRPWGGWWCGWSIFYLVRLSNYRLSRLMGTSIRRGVVDPKIVPFLQYLSSQTQFILKGIPKELSEILDTNLTERIVAQSQEIASTVEKIAKDLKIPEGLNLQNIDTLFGQINSSIDQMTQQISPWLINSFSEIANSVQSLISEVKNAGSILPEVAYQLKSIIPEAESIYVNISQTLREKIGEQSLDRIRENLVKVGDVTDSIFTQIEGQLASIPVQRLEELTPALTQLGSVSSELLSQLKIDPKILSKMGTTLQKGKIPEITKWILPGVSSVEIGSKLLKTTEAAKFVKNMDPSKLVVVAKMSRQTANFGSGLKQAAKILAKILQGFRF